jgi:hypothetical protein
VAPIKYIVGGKYVWALKCGTQMCFYCVISSNIGQSFKDGDDVKIMQDIDSPENEAVY